MHLMQYEITLPADYDMAVIRDRVATRGSLTDHLPGLGLKAYAIRRRGAGGSPVNQYAPFYLWAGADGMAGFMLGDLFRGLCESFGRPPVRHWLGLSFESGPALGRPPRAATRCVERLGPDDDLADLARRRRRDGTTSTHPALHSTASVVDPTEWELARFSLWSQDVPDAAGTHYEILHVSTPEIGALGPDLGAPPSHRTRGTSVGASSP